MTDPNRAKEIYEAALRTAANTRQSPEWHNTAAELIWLSQCTDAERAEALRMLDDRAAARAT